MKIIKLLLTRQISNNDTQSNQRHQLISSSFPQVQVWVAVSARTWNDCSSAESNHKALLIRHWVCCFLEYYELKILILFPIYACYQAFNLIHTRMTWHTQCVTYSSVSFSQKIIHHPILFQHRRRRDSRGKRPMNWALTSSSTWVWAKGLATRLHVDLPRVTVLTWPTASCEHLWRSLSSVEGCGIFFLCT